MPIRKSRMIPRQEQLAYELLESQETISYTYKVNEEQKEFHILSPEPEIMNGLTRKERQLKQLLFMALDQLYSSENVAEVRYWYTEWSPERYFEIQRLDFENAWKELYENTKYGWTAKHEQFCEKLIKGQPFFEKMWEVENGPRVN